MKVHQVIFKKTEAFLKKHLGNKLNIDIEKYDDGYKETHISITDTDFWVSCDDRELTLEMGLIIDILILNMMILTKLLKYY